MDIVINTQILSGNLGCHWIDENEAADALGRYTEKTWLADLAPVIADGHEVTIRIDVEHRASGCGRDMCVTVSGDDDDAVYAMEQRVDAMLSSEQEIWQRFCDSDDAADLAAE